MIPRSARSWLGLLTVVLVIAGTVSILTDDGSAPKVKPVVVVDPADPGPAIKAPAALVKRAEQDAADTHGLLEHEDLKGKPLTDAQKAANARAAKRAGVTGISPVLAFGASFEQRGCRTIPLGVNFSSRPSGVKPTISGAGHITVSNEIAGWADVLGITRFFGSLGVGASSHYVIDAEGHCAYLVPETMKAWTSGNMNPVTACNIEGIGQPGNNSWTHPAGFAKGVLVLRDCSKRWGIPLQVGNTAGCSVRRAGFVDHNELECSNDHWDICSVAEKARTSGSDPCPLVFKIVAAMRASAPVLSPLELKLVRSARHPVGTGHSRRFWCRRISSQILWLARSPDVPRRDRRIAILRRVWLASCS